MPISSTVEKLERLQQLQHVDLTELSTKVIQRSSKVQRQESYKQALVELNRTFEQYLLEAVTLAFSLHPGQAKKMRYKKDRIKIFKQHGMDYLSIDGAETALILGLISHAIIYDDATVTTDLNDAFPFWKEGFPMVQFDNTYEILSEDIQIHFQNILTTFLSDQV